MRQNMRARVNVAKVSGYAVIANALQILFAAGIFLYAILAPEFRLNGAAEKALVALMTLVVIWGAALDIREAFSARRVVRQSRMLEEAMGQLESLNGTLRAQRHDFMNHLQVVYSLMEMEEYGEAREYIERVYGDIQRVGRVLKTALPAVNALLAAKEADCGEKGIAMELDFSSAWQNLTMPAWEMCRVLGNLIDNAMDALLSIPEAERPPEGLAIRVSIGEDVQSFTFCVANNGPVILPELRDSIFQMGFTTKRAGRGMGLHIVRSLMNEYGGAIQLDCESGETAFRGTLPKAVPPKQP